MPTKMLTVYSEVRRYEAHSASGVRMLTTYSGHTLYHMYACAGPTHHSFDMILAAPGEWHLAWEAWMDGLRRQ